MEPPTDANEAIAEPSRLRRALSAVVGVTRSAIRALLPASLRESPAHGRERRLLMDTVLLGVLGALGAQVFNWLLRVSNREHR